MTDPAKAGERGKPILFSAAMVRALLAGTKTQTRRVLKGAWQHALEGHDEVLTWFAPAHVPKEGIINEWAESGIWARKHGPRGYNRHLGYVPFRPGCRLWVRESHALVPASAYRCSDGVVQAVNPTDQYEAAVYRADWVRSAPPWRPSIHMPRWASRLTLIVTDVRVQRLQDISEEDARAEGVGLYVPGHGFITEDELRADPGYSNFLAPRLGFEAIWTEINGAGSWNANPWCAAYSFEVHHQNIDAPASVEEPA